jgi:hypothetical protein
VLVREDGSSVEHLPPSSDVSAKAEIGTRSEAANTSRLENRAFWDKFIQRVSFDHPDQPPPRHGGNNYARLELPGPVAGLVAYRTAAARAGFMLKFLGVEGREALESLLQDQAAVEQEIAQPVRFEVGVGAVSEQVAREMLIEFQAPQDSAQRDGAQLTWLLRTVNSVVNALRPRLSAWRS